MTNLNEIIENNFDHIF